MAIDMTLFDDCTDGGWLTIFGETARQELAFPPAYLQPVAPLKGVLLTRQSTFNLGLKLPVELVLGNTTCSKVWRDNQSSLLRLHVIRKSLYYQ